MNTQKRVKINIMTGQGVCCSLSANYRSTISSIILLFNKNHQDTLVYHHYVTGLNIKTDSKKFDSRLIVQESKSFNYRTREYVTNTRIVLPGTGMVVWQDNNPEKFLIIDSFNKIVDELYLYIESLDVNNKGE